MVFGAADGEACGVRDMLLCGVSTGVSDGVGVTIGSGVELDNWQAERRNEQIIKDNFFNIPKL